MPRSKELVQRRRPDAFSIRLDPKLRFAAELAAAKERRSLSSLVEWALDQTCRNITVVETEQEFINAMRVADWVWDSDEARRLMLLAAGFPSLLTSEQQQLHHLIFYNRYFLAVEAPPDLPRKDIVKWVNWTKVRENWEKLKQVAAGILPEDALPTVDQIEQVNSKVSSKADASKQARANKVRPDEPGPARKAKAKKTP
jgi:hypothetical protein